MHLTPHCVCRGWLLHKLIYPYEQSSRALSISSESINNFALGARRNYSMQPTLNFSELDKKWQKIWHEQAQGKERIAAGRYGGKKMYILPMFPYPSGNLHLGHFRTYTIPDVLARFRRMQGYDVLLPMGWDAFGLPAENAAIDRGIDPATWTRNNIAKMKSQLQSMNGSWNWDRVR